MPFTISPTPAPITISIRPRWDWKILLTVLSGFLYIFLTDPRSWGGDRVFDSIFMAFILVGAVLYLIRRERIEVYPDQIVWNWTYFGITRKKSAPSVDVLGVEWNEGERQGRRGKGPDYVEFYLPDSSVKTCFGFTFDEFDEMRTAIGSMYPELIKRWGSSTIRSKDFTLLNLT